MTELVKQSGRFDWGRVTAYCVILVLHASLLCLLLGKPAPLLDAPAAPDASGSSQRLYVRIEAPSTATLTVPPVNVPAMDVPAVRQPTHRQQPDIQGPIRQGASAPTQDTDSKGPDVPALPLGQFLNPDGSIRVKPLPAYRPPPDNVVDMTSRNIIRCHQTRFARAAPRYESIGVHFARKYLVYLNLYNRYFDYKNEVLQASIDKSCGH